MALALHPNPSTRQHVRPVRHLHLVPALDPTPVGAYRPSTRGTVRPLIRPAAQHPSMSGVPTAATFQRRRVVVVVVTMLLLGVVVAGLIGFTGTSAQADQAKVGQSFAPRTVVAQPGDTLWAIAKRVAPQANIADLVDQLVRINGDAIVAGQLVRIP